MASDPKRRSSDNPVPVPPIVRRARGVAYGVQSGYAQALRGIPCPRALTMQDGVVRDAGEIPRPTPSIGYQCSPYGEK